MAVSKTSSNNTVQPAHHHHHFTTTDHQQHYYFKPAPAEICYGKMRFLITDRPTNYTINNFIEELKKHNCHDVVRVCEPSYTVEPLKREGIDVLDWEFPDGSPPPAEIKEKWLQLVKTRFKEEPGCCIAVHCVAGLGRAPVLVALSLMEAGMKYEDAVEFIREHRRGAINKKQLEFLENYRSGGLLKKLKQQRKSLLKTAKNSQDQQDSDHPVDPNIQMVSGTGSASSNNNNIHPKNCVIS